MPWKPTHSINLLCKRRFITFSSQNMWIIKISTITTNTKPPAGSQRSQPFPKKTSMINSPIIMIFPTQGSYNQLETTNMRISWNFKHRLSNIISLIYFRICLPSPERNDPLKRHFGKDWQNLPNKQNQAYLHIKWKIQLIWQWAKTPSRWVPSPVRLPAGEHICRSPALWGEETGEKRSDHWNPLWWRRWRVQKPLAVLRNPKLGKEEFPFRDKQDFLCIDLS